MLIKGGPPYLYFTIHSFLSTFWANLVKIPQKLEIRLSTPKKYGWDFWKFFSKKYDESTPKLKVSFKNIDWLQKYKALKSKIIFKKAQFHKANGR